MYRIIEITRLFFLVQSEEGMGMGQKFLQLKGYKSAGSIFISLLKIWGGFVL